MPAEEKVHPSICLWEFGEPFRVRMNRQAAPVGERADGAVAIGTQHLYSPLRVAFERRLGGMAKRIGFSDRDDSDAWRDGSEKPFS